jgi:repressor LexA
MRRTRRGVRLIPEAVPVTPAGTLPLLGRIAAGHPIEAVAEREAVDVPSRLRTRADCYVLEVRGDSMIEDGILDGDWIVVEPRDHARNGEVVVALVDGTEVTLKRLLQRPGEVVLIPANSAMAPMHFAPEQVAIQGVVVGQMRSYR